MLESGAVLGVFVIGLKPRCVSGRNCTRQSEERASEMEVGMMGIQRSTHDRWLLGVCGGIGHRFGWSPALVRVVFALLGVVVPGVSIFMVAIAYIVMGIFLPESPEF